MTARCALCMGALKIVGSPWLRPRLLFPKFLMGFCSDWACKCACKIWNLSLSRSWDNRGYPKILGSLWIRPRSLFSKIFNGLLFGWNLWMYWSNLKFVAFPVPEIIGGTRKNWAVPGYAHAHFSPKFLMGFCSDGPSECTSQIWNP